MKQWYLVIILLGFWACQPAIDQIPIYQESKTKTKAIHTLYQLLMGTGVKMSNRTSEYLNMLKISYGLDSIELSQAIELLDQFEEGSSAYDAVENGIRDALMELDFEEKISQNFDRDFFIQNVLSPYLTIRFHKQSIVKELDQKVRKRFHQYFAESENRNPLNTLFQSMESYHLGNGFYAKHLTDFNEFMVKYGYYLYLDVKTPLVHTFKIKEVKSNLTKGLESISSSQNEFQVLTLKRFYPHLLPALWGASTIGDKYVVVFEDGIAANSLELQAQVSPLKERFYTNTSEEYFWRINQIPLDLEIANLIRSELLERDFGENYGESLQVEKLSLTTAIHEAKHKYDEGILTLNLDVEISAYYTQIVLGPDPHYSLMKTISWMEDSWQSSYEPKLSRELKFLWSVASSAIIFQPDSSGSWIRQRMHERYHSYRTIQANKLLPKLSNFETISWIENI